LLRRIELEVASGGNVTSACRNAGISDATYYTWRKRYGGMAKSGTVMNSVFRAILMERKEPSYGDRERDFGPTFGRT
jgi:transposase-like protein